MTTELVKSRQTASSAHALKTIMVAIDFSAASYESLNWAVDLARAHGARVIVTHAIDERVPGFAERDVLSHQVEHRLMDICNPLRSTGLIAEPKWAPGRPWDVIPNMAQETDSDLVVIGANGGHSFKAALLGTTADRLIRSASTPILVHRGPPGSPSRTSIQRILAATDFSEEAALAIALAIRLVEFSKQPLRLVLLHAVSLFPVRGETIVAPTLPDYWEEAVTRARRKLEAIASHLRRDRLTIEIKAAPGYPAETILQEAVAIDADLIAIGATGRGVNRFLVGSEAERVLHRAKCSVLAVRKGRRSPAPRCWFD